MSKKVVREEVEGVFKGNKKGKMMSESLFLNLFVCLFVCFFFCGRLDNEKRLFSRVSHFSFY